MKISKRFWKTLTILGFLLAGIGSLSGLGSLQGLLALWLASAGSLIQNMSRRAWRTAFIQAVLLYWLILPQGILFR